MKPTGKAYLLSTPHWDNSLMYTLLSEDFSISTHWESSLASLEGAVLTKDQTVSETTIEDFLIRYKHITLCAIVDLPFRLDDYPELLI